MILDGSAVLAATPEQVWSVITDPAVLARTIPGCESLQRVDEDSYTLVVTAGIGAIRGKYAGEVRLADKLFPKSYVMHASGSGGPGSVRATVQVELAPCETGTELTYSADAVVGGPVAGVGQRMITGVAKRMAEQFFTAVDREINEPNVVATVPPEPVARDGAPAAWVADPLTPAKVLAAADGWVPTGSRPLLVGAAGGGLLTLLGVCLGYALGRRR